MSYQIREINPNNDTEIDWVTEHTMETVLETVPEFKNDPQLVLQQFSNFTFPQMREMIASNLPKENHRLLVIENSLTKELVGHAIFSIKEDEEGIKYGFCYSRYIASQARKKGLATQLLEQAETWWRSLDAKYIIAQTHISNYKLQGLFQKFGYKQTGPKQGKGYQFYLLRKELNIK